MNYFVENKHILHSAICNETLRKWHTLNCEITANNLMYPIFIANNDDAIQPIKSMPGISRFGVNKLKEHLSPIVEKGLTSVLLFGVTENMEKDDIATLADNNENCVIRAIPMLRAWFPKLIIACDVCLCPYISHGHCGILRDDATINNSESIKRIAQVSLSYAKAGAHIVAPSDMMDGRIKAIKDILRQNNLENKVSILSYAVKFASGFYGPFRDAANSKPSFGDRKCYQLPPGSEGLARRAANRDVEEGADMLMVKPGVAYLDIVKQVKQDHPEYPLFVYQVSGEYAMIYHGANSGALDLKTVLLEILTSMRRAGADVIISYFTPIVLDWIK